MIAPHAIRLKLRVMWMVLLVALPAASLAQATIEGWVELPKPSAAPLMIKRYEIISKAGVLSPNPAIAIIYLDGRFPGPNILPVRQIIQTNYAFVPALLAVQVGTKVEFPNHDDAFHNIFSYSPAKRFDLGRYRPEDRPIPAQVFDKPGLVTLRCDVHEHMRGLILVLETPYFVTTDLEGRFKLTGLPEGAHVLKAWLNSQATVEIPVKLTNGITTRVELPTMQPKPRERLK